MAALGIPTMMPVEIESAWGTAARSFGGCIHQQRIACPTSSQVAIIGNMMQLAVQRRPQNRSKLRLEESQYGQRDTDGACQETGLPPLAVAGTAKHRH